MEFMENWEKTKERFDAFWQGELLDRCMIAVCAPRKTGWKSAYPFPDDPKEQESWWLDGEYVFKRQWEYINNTAYFGDAFPHLTLNTGTAGQIVKLKGVKCSYAPETVWFEPVIHDIEYDKIAIDNNSWLYRKTIELAKYLSGEARGRVLVTKPDAGGNLDALAHMRGSENLLMDLLSEPEWVHASLETIQTAWESFMDECFEITKNNNEGAGAIGWMNLWAGGKLCHIQSDFSVMISSELFDEFVKPELLAQAAWGVRSIYHVDGQEQIRHLDTILSIDSLDAIQWTSVAGQPSPVEFIPQLKRIQAAGKRLVVYPGTANEIQILLTELSSKGLLLSFNANSSDEAQYAIKLAEKLSHE